MAMLSVGTDAGSLTDISLDPSAMAWGLMDISASDAGRVQDSNTTMYKMRVGQKRKITLTWNNPTAAQVAEILQAFNPEYVFVRYFDAMDGAWGVREFYVGDRSAPLRWFSLPKKGTRYSTLSFDIIER
jgi:hypothetical protein